MVTILALALLQTAVPPATEDAFVEGPIECHLVDRTMGVVRMSFELDAYRLVVREGAGFVPDGAEIEAGTQDSGMGSMRLRERYFFSDQSNAPAARFELVDRVADGYRAISLGVFRQVSVPMGHGSTHTQSRLAAIGMCEPADRHEGSQVRS
jgi:hypothetical protein